MGTRWNSLYGRKDICSKQQEAQGENTMGEPQCGGCGTSRTTKDVRVAQKKLLVARFKRGCQEIHVRLFQVSAK